MNCKTVTGMAMAMVLTAGQATAFGAVIHEHIGDENPVNEGFTMSSTGGVAAGEAVAVTVDGVDAWRIRKTSTTAGTRTYNAPLTEEQRSEAFAEGFIIRANVRVHGNNNNLTGSPTVDFIATTGQRYAISFGNNTADNNKVIVSVNGTNYDTGLSDAVFALYELKYNPVTEDANLYINGDLALSDLAPTTLMGFNRFHFGLNSSGAAGAGDFNLVQFEIIPEPASIALLGLGSLLLMRRKRLA
ncbi:PEP-CTERM sorting domain-containing protein [Phycisphaerales bacterium AB-hyl4]|uniref:PEP-CTERM sorting domain-containing protein n=1 Tax=Natronomicrosphaera hydrolytica TaxID=3242702 RepID=A0ABV4U7A6_9BACT